MNETESFALSYDGEKSVLINRNANASVLQESLNSIAKIRSRGRVNVSSKFEENCTLFRLEFEFTDPNDVKLMVDATEHSPTPVQTIKRVVTGGSTGSGVKLSYGGICSDVIQPGFTATKVRNVLKDLFSWKCQYAPAIGQWFGR